MLLTGCQCTNSHASFYCVIICVELQVQDLEDAAVRIGKSVSKLGRDIKHWEVWQWIRERIDNFKRTMPLISDLRNPAMRPRHWKSLCDTIQTTFDPASDAFTLDSIVALRLDQHAEFISEMSLNATKELAIEQSLATIAEAWKTLDLDMVRHQPVNTQNKQSWRMQPVPAKDV